MKISSEKMLRRQEDANTMVTVRPVKPSELPNVYQLIQANTDDWSDVTMETIGVYYRLDPPGFKVAIISESAEIKIVGSFFACNIDIENGFGDLFVVSKDYRRRGIGSLLLKAAVCHFGQRNWAVDAEMSARNHFLKLGCKHVGKAQVYSGYPMVSSNLIYSNHHRTGKPLMRRKRSSFHELDRPSRRITSNEKENVKDVTHINNSEHHSILRGTKRSKSLADFSELHIEDSAFNLKHKTLPAVKTSKDIADNRKGCKCKSRVCVCYRIVQETDVEFADIVEYDSRIHCTPRGHHLKQWFGYTGSHTHVCIDSNKRIVGYASARPICDNEFEIGPLFAEEPSVARRLMRTLIKRFPLQRLNVLIPLSNRNAIEMAQSLGLSKDGAPFTRMYSKSVISVPYEKVFVMHKFGIA